MTRLYDQRILQNDWGILSLKVGLVELAMEHWSWAFTGVGGWSTVSVYLDSRRTTMKREAGQTVDK